MVHSLSFLPCWIFSQLNYDDYDDVIISMIILYDRPLIASLSLIEMVIFYKDGLAGAKSKKKKIKTRLCMSRAVVPNYLLWIGWAS